MSLINLEGQRFGRLVALSKEPARSDAETRWRCRCDCGVEKAIRTKDLRRGMVRSCGCHKRARTIERNKSHGLTGSPEYISWAAMVQRCSNPKATHFEYYGGRGIGVCERWSNSFDLFLSDVGPRPGPGFSLDRIDNSRGYEPGNVRWASRIDQMQNTRRARKIEFMGQSVTVSAACRMAAVGVTPQTAIRRLNLGWPPDAAVTVPPGVSYTGPRTV